VQNYVFKFQAIAEKTAKNVRGYFILPHPAVVRIWQVVCHFPHFWGQGVQRRHQKCARIITVQDY